MDTCVALVQAYLHLNGYFTVVEYPVIEASAHGHARALTDLDILAVRFPGASHDVVQGRAPQRFAGTSPIDSGATRGSTAWPCSAIEVSRIAGNSSLTREF